MHSQCEFVLSQLLKSSFDAHHSTPSQLYVTLFQQTIAQIVDGFFVLYFTKLT